MKTIDKLYEKWKEAVPETKDAIKDTLYMRLLKDGERIVYANFRRDFPDAIAAAAAEMILELERFKGTEHKTGKEALFSHYFYTRVVRTVLREIRTEKRQQDILSGSYEDFLHHEEDRKLASAQVDSWLESEELTNEDKALLEAKLEGKRWIEVADDLKTTEAAIWKRWEKLKGRLKGMGRLEDVSIV